MVRGALSAIQQASFAQQERTGAYGAQLYIRRLPDHLRQPQGGGGQYRCFGGCRRELVAHHEQQVLRCEPLRQLVQATQCHALKTADLLSGGYATYVDRCQLEFFEARHDL